ncbi:hypothetical protein M3689_07145 [Alkalihalophilus marmarensis]|jgi:hypothetical protein|uniref:Uncharacterized protein n=1 Tax=Alkalihalophilus marmarensis DSM 21297 TaxID=1188261 RepID=U6SMJ8_9BACI|nr:hypothetical protein [Alkalihalophilus marmarensis]ERN52818.1 hypothetical protein A33I_14070 [Alkalihalophilus marmarensis DSM 21297]MCM3489069.1 hypothetical protein [Alkalihalophilus marmarensis]
MKRTTLLLVFVFGVILLSGCSESFIPEELGIDSNRVKEELLKLDIMIENGYSKRHIEFTKICAVIHENKSEHKGDYFLYWQTTDAPTADYGGYYMHRVNINDYSIHTGINQFVPYEEVGCFAQDDENTYN